MTQDCPVTKYQRKHIGELEAPAIYDCLTLTILRIYSGASHSDQVAVRKDVKILYMKKRKDLIDQSAKYKNDSIKNVLPSEDKKSLSIYDKIKRENEKEITSSKDNRKEIVEKLKDSVLDSTNLENEKNQKSRNAKVLPIIIHENPLNSHIDIQTTRSSANEVKHYHNEVLNNPTEHVSEKVGNPVVYLRSLSNRDRNGAVIPVSNTDSHKMINELAENKGNVLMKDCYA